VAIPEVSGQAKGAVGLLLEGDVIRAFELNDVIAFGFVFAIASGLDVREQGQPQPCTRQPQGLDVFDLRFDFREVTDLVSMAPIIRVPFRVVPGQRTSGGKKRGL
jgi:hypothetical protein